MGSKQLIPTKEERRQFDKDVAVIRKFNRGQESGGKVFGRTNYPAVMKAIKRVKRYQDRYGTQ